MNPVHRHPGTGKSDRPPGDMDSGYWHHEYHRVTDHADRCEVVRRAGTYLASLIRRDPDAPRGNDHEKHLTTDVLIEGQGWPLVDVARRFRLTERTIATIRITDGRHPLTGRHWTPPGNNTQAAHEARLMRSHDLACVDIAQALGRNVNTVYTWTAKAKQAA